MASANVSGAISGIDTAGLIDKLISVEGSRQRKLKTQLTTEQDVLKVFQDLSAKLANLQSVSKEIVANGGFAPMTATSNNTAVTATASGGAAAASLDFTVNQLAATHKLTFNTTAAASDVVVKAGSTNVTLTKSDGTAVTIDTGDGTLQGLADGINKAGAGVTATLLTLDDGKKRLSVTAANSGAAGSFTLKNTDGSDLLGGATVRQGQNASITIGPDTITSASNTFDKVSAGLSFTLGADSVGKQVQINVAANSAGAKDSAKKMVDIVNELLTKIDSVSKYDATTKKGGILMGDSTASDLRSNLLRAVYPQGGGTLGALGIETDRYGKLKFDETKFNAAYTKDPAAVTKALGAGTPADPGWVGRLQAVATKATDPTSGTVATRISGENARIARFTADIAAWDTRLAEKRTQLTKQFTAMEKALAKMQLGGNAVQGAIASFYKN